MACQALRSPARARAWRSVGPPSRVRDQARSWSTATGGGNWSGNQVASASTSAGSKRAAGGLALNHTVPPLVGTRATTEYGRPLASAGPVRASPPRAHSAEIQSSASATHAGSCHGGIPATGSGALISVNSTELSCRPLMLQGKVTAGTAGASRVPLAQRGLPWRPRQARRFNEAMRAPCDEIADWYEYEFLGTQDARAADPLGIDHCLRALLGQGSGICLEIGCGTGVHAATVTDLGWTPAGIDMSAGMLRHARGRLAIARADAERLPVRDSAIPAVISVMAHTDMPGYPAALREAARVLRPGGTLV